MLYGAEIWGCNQNLEGVEQTQLRATEMCSMKTHREPLLAIVQEHQEVDHDTMAAFLLSFACRNSHTCTMCYPMGIYISTLDAICRSTKT